MCPPPPWLPLPHHTFICVPDTNFISHMCEQCEVRIRRGTIGSHRYYCISFRRNNPEQMLLVADRQVCVLNHVVWISQV